MGKLDRKFTVFQLFPADKELIQRLTESGKNRHEVFLELVPIVESLESLPVKPDERKSIRLGIPAELEAALDKAKSVTNRSKIELLLTAARIYLQEELSTDRNSTTPAQ